MRARLLLCVGAALLPGAALAASVPAAGPFDLVVLDAGGRLWSLRSDRPAEAREARLQGVRGTLVAIDVRPVDRRLYGLSDTHDLYVLDLAAGRARLAGVLTVAFDGGPRSGFDFNPQSDRLRILAASGQNLRVHPASGATAMDAPLAYAPGDPHAGRRPQIVAAAYTRSLPKTSTTELFDIDAALDVLVLQEPPNDGLLRTVGPLGAEFGPATGFDIVSLASGEELGFAASGAVLYRVDLATGRARALGAIATGGSETIGLAVLPP